MKTTTKILRKFRIRIMSESLYQKYISNANAVKEMTLEMDSRSKRDNMFIAHLLHENAVANAKLLRYGLSK